MTTVHEAYRALLDLANHGREYPKNEVTNLLDSDPTASEIVSKGFDLERSVKVTLDGTDVATKVRLRVLAMTNGKLLIRTWLEWTSPFGDHRSFVCYELTPEIIDMLAEQASNPQPEEEIDEDTIDMDVAVGMLFEHFDTQDALGTDWQQMCPQHTNECAAYHAELIVAARDTEPKLLNMLSDTELGAAEAQEIIDLYDWLSQQREVSAFV